MKKIVFLGSLSKGRTFTYNGRRFKVAANLGSGGVSVRPLATRTVTIAGKTFEKKETKTEVWSIESDVEINTREKVTTETEEESS